VVLHGGCGRAPLPAELAERGWREIREDIDPAVEPDQVGSITVMDRIADGSIDAIWSSHNLEHLADPDVPRALAEFLRVLRPGGVAWIALPDVQEPGGADRQR
jgi:predicted SAM-dependent methyltransferase